LWSFVQALLMALGILLIHTYFGFFASGGPSGVGVATGDAVRTSLVMVVAVTLLVSLAIYGSQGRFNLAGERAQVPQKVRYCPKSSGAGSA